MQVFWDGEQQWYEGEVVRYSASSGRHTVLYDDGDLQQELLPGIPHRCLPPSRDREQATFPCEQDQRAARCGLR